MIRPGLLTPPNDGRSGVEAGRTVRSLEARSASAAGVVQSRALVGGPVTLVGGLVTLGGGPVTLVGGLVTLVGGPVTLVGDPVTLVGGLVACVGGPVTLVRDLVAFACGPVTLVGDLVAVVSDLLAFLSDPIAPIGFLIPLARLRCFERLPQPIHAYPSSNSSRTAGDCSRSFLRSERTTTRLLSPLGCFDRPMQGRFRPVQTRLRALDLGLV